MLLTEKAFSYADINNFNLLQRNSTVLYHNSHVGPTFSFTIS